MITLIKLADTECRPYGLSSSGYYTAYSFIKDGKEHFICNLIQGSTERYSSDEYKRNEVAGRIRQLRKNDFKFIRFHGREKHPIDFIKFVKENNYTFQIYGELFEFGENSGFTDFHGNLWEYSASFHYRIYDKEILMELQRIVATMPQRYHFKREPAKY